MIKIEDFKIISTKKEIIYYQKITVNEKIIELLKKICDYENEDFEYFVKTTNKNKQFEICYFEETNHIFPKIGTNNFKLIKKNEKINKNDIEDFKMFLNTIFENSKSIIKTDCEELIEQIKEYSFGKYCTECKYFSMCNDDYNLFQSTKERKHMHCNSYRGYFLQRKKISNPKEIEENFQKNLSYYKKFLIEIYEIQKTHLKIEELGITIKNNWFVRDYLNEEKINFYFNNTNINKGE